MARKKDRSQGTDESRSARAPADSRKSKAKVDKKSADKRGLPRTKVERTIEDAGEDPPHVKVQPAPGDAKHAELELDRVRPVPRALSTDQGIPIPHTDDSLKAGVRGPTLLEDFHLREKITHFDHERIPERVVHARGSGAHGYFKVYESLEDLTCADFLCDPSVKTPVFVRFSTVVGSRGSADTARDVRGFATKFYTREGNFDLVGNNMPVFFIQDGIKFPDLVHAVKPEPHNEMPQAASAHDTFWDFVSLVPETLHMVMWVMSDRAIPRSYRMMEGFGVHTFRLVDADGRAVLCKFHWKPLLGAHSLVWDEAQEISGRDPDFHRRDLWEAIECGSYPEWELGLQIVEERDQLAYGFDMLDATKLLPEELVPVRRVGKLTLDRNPDNFFAETEQVAFCVANVVPGIDFSNDPLMQARLFSYLDTQLTRLGGPNFAELPINRPLAGVRNHQQDGFMRRGIPTSRALYHPNTIGGGWPKLAAPHPAGFSHFPEEVAGEKTRERSDSFADHVSQARLFLHSQSPFEREHLVDACRFELSKVERLAIRQRVCEHFARIDRKFAEEVARVVGVTLGEGEVVPAKRSARNGSSLAVSPALSLANSPRVSIKTRKVACLVADGVRFADIEPVRAHLQAGGAKLEVIAPSLRLQTTAEGNPLAPDKSFLVAASVEYDAVYVPGGAESVATLAQREDALRFVRGAFRHAKPVGATREGVDLLFRAGLPVAEDESGVVSIEGLVTCRDDEHAEFAAAFADAIREHRHFGRDVRAMPS